MNYRKQNGLNNFQENAKTCRQNYLFNNGKEEDMMSTVRLVFVLHPCINYYFQYELYVSNF